MHSTWALIVFMILGRIVWGLQKAVVLQKILSSQEKFSYDSTAFSNL